MECDKYVEAYDIQWQVSIDLMKIVPIGHTQISAVGHTIHESKKQYCKVFDTNNLQKSVVPFWG